MPSHFSPASDLGAQVQDEQSIGNETVRPKDPQISQQTEANKWTERGTTSGASNVENPIAIAQPEVHFNDNEGSTTEGNLCFCQKLHDIPLLLLNLRSILMTMNPS